MEKIQKKMPFKSKAQMRAAFGGYLGSEMKDKAKQWAKETPDAKKLPAHVGDKKKKHSLKAFLGKEPHSKKWGVMLCYFLLI